MNENLLELVYLRGYSIGYIKSTSYKIENFTRPILTPIDIDLGDNKWNLALKESA